MKKWAIRGLVTLSVVIALCMFFSGTIKTLTTAKVKLVTAKNGRLEETLALKGELTFPRTYEIQMNLEDNESLVIRRVMTYQGGRVEKGDTLIEAEVLNYDATRRTLQAEYETAQKAYLELERKNSGLRLRVSEESWISAYDALAAAGQDMMQAQIDLQAAADLAGISLDDGKLPEGTEDAALLEAYQKAVDAQEAQQRAQNRFDEANRLGISDKIVEYVIRSRELSAQIQQIQAELTRLEVLKQQAAAIQAPHDGYVIELGVKAGDTFNGKNRLLLMSAEGQAPVLRANVSALGRDIETDAKVEVAGGSGKHFDKVVTGTGVNSEGEAVIDVELTDKDVTALGGGIALLGEQVDMTVTYKAAASSTLLPASAVRGSGADRYVYVATEEWSKLGKTVLKAEKRSVKVLAENGSTASIQEDLSNEQVAYMEDRAISNGSEVMAYGE